MVVINHDVIHNCQTCSTVIETVRVGRAALRNLCYWLQLKLYFTEVEILRLFENS